MRDGHRRGAAMAPRRVLLWCIGLAPIHGQCVTLQHTHTHTLTLTFSQLTSVAASKTKCAAPQKKNTPRTACYYDTKCSNNNWCVKTGQISHASKCSWPLAPLHCMPCGLKAFSHSAGAMPRHPCPMSQRRVWHLLPSGGLLLERHMHLPAE